MRNLKLEEILELHVMVVQRYGGSMGVRELGRLESVIASQHQQVFGQELYPGLQQKAAVIMRNIIADHPFVDGNKRTASLAALTLLELNGQKFIAKPGELEDFAVKIATNKLNIDEIADWLTTHTTKA